MGRLALLRALAVCVLLALPLALPEAARAQWAVGARYEHRAGKGGHGVALQGQRSFATGAPALEAFVRGTAAYFPTQEEQHVTPDYERVARTWSCGAALGAGLARRYGHLRLYAGLDGGYEQRVEWAETVGLGTAPRQTSTDAGSLYAAPFVGASVAGAGGVRLYAEYSHLGYRAEPFRTAGGRWAAGVSIQF